MDSRKEWNVELRAINQMERKLARDLARHEQQCERQMSVIMRSLELGRRRTSKELDRLSRRRLILEGRLS